MSNYTIKVTIDGDDNLTPVVKKANKEVDKLQNNVNETGKASTGASTGLNTLASGAKMLGGAIAGIAIMDKISELNQLGMEAGGTRIMFDAMVGGANNASASLERMKKATFGVVDDITLMGSATTVLDMGLAKTTAEAEKLVEMAFKLKKPTDSASDALESFTLMLANQSVARLDSFGLSSGRVRTRIEELIETGKALNREEAFTMAVLEMGGEKIEKFGDAIEKVNNTAFARMQAKVTDLTTSLGEFVATGVEAGAMVLETAFIGAEEIGEGRGSEFGQAFINAVISEITGQPMPPIEVEIKANLDTFKEQQSLLQAFVNNPRPSLGSPDDEGLLGADDLKFMNDLVTQSTIARNKGDKYLTASVVSTNEYMDMINGVQDSWERANQAVQEQDLRVQRVKKSGEVYYQSMIAGYKESNMLAQETADNQEYASQALRDFMQSGNNFRQINSGINQGQLIDGTAFINQADSDALSGAFDSVIQSYEELVALNEQGFITDEQLTKAERMVESFTDVATEAKNIALAIDDISLDELLGVADVDSQLMQLGSMVGSQITDDELRAQYEKNLARRSGASNNLSESLDVGGIIANTLLEIGATQGGDKMAMATQQVQESLQQSVQLGLNADEAVIEALKTIGFVAEGGGTITIDVKAGDTPIGIANEYGVPLDDIYGSDSGIYRNGYLQQGSFELGSGGGLVPFGQSSYATGSLGEMFGMGGDDLFAGLGDKIAETFENLPSPDFSEIASSLKGALTGIMDEISGTTYTTKLKVQVEYGGGALANMFAGASADTGSRQSAGRPATTPRADTR